MIRCVLFLLLLVFCSCRFFESENKAVSPKDSPIIESILEKIIPQAKLDTVQHLQQYEELKASISQQRQTFKQARLNNEKAVNKEAANYLFETLTDSIFPYWYGTKWDFNGITETPRKGKIACGYFVTTTLRDAGIKLQRYKLAQQAAANIAKKLCKPQSIKWFNDVESMSAHLNKQKDQQLYVIGLDYHVGFIVHENGENFFVHANYAHDQEVIREPLETSAVIKASKAYVIGNLLDNEDLIRTWLR